MPNLPENLFGLLCNDNQLNSLPELPGTIRYLYCSNNPGISCLPMLPDSLEEFFLQNTSINCVPNIPVMSPPFTILPVCDLFNANGCDFYWNVMGNIYFDSNSNCNYDSADVSQPNIPVDLWQGVNLLQQTFSIGGGTYSFDVNSVGTYEVTIDTTNLPFYVLCPNSGVHTSIITAFDSTDSDADFALICKPDYNVTVNSVIRDSGLIRPGNKSLINIHAGDFANFYGADCMNGIGGQLQVTVTGPAQYIGYAIGSIAPTTVTGNTLTWNIVDFGTVDFFHDFHIRLLTDTTATVGDFVCVDATISSNPADVNQSNNHLNQCFAVVNSFDPNVKEVSPQELTNVNKWLTYTIHFQNTGNAPAQHIQILDTLDTDFNVSTFQLLAYSHANMTQVLEGGIVHFNFPNINLPDSNSNEPASHGYIQYKIKPKAGTQITSSFDNTASIYFDFNAPVVTNTTHTTFTTGIGHLAVDSWQLSVYPNPFSNEFTVDSKQLAGSTITISDILGRTIYSEQTNQKSVSINLKSISSGIYFIKVQLQNGELHVKKIVKQ